MSATVDVGDAAPDFTLPGVQGTERRDYTLSEYRGRKVVLAFYPGDFTPGCTKQMCQYRDSFEEFQGVEAVLLGISPQDVDSHAKWIAKRDFPFPLLADTEKKVIDAYGVRGFGPIAVKRSTFVIDAEGIIRHRRSASLGVSWDKPGVLAKIVAGVEPGMQIDTDTALEFLRGHPHAVLATTRRDGRPQLSPIVATVDDEGLVAISSRETAVKVKNLRRDPHASLCVVNDGFYGEWMQIEGPATILSLPDAMEPLVEYYRALSGEHPDWDDYRAAMTRDQRVLIRVRPERAGPNVSG